MSSNPSPCYNRIDFPICTSGEVFDRLVGVLYDGHALASVRRPSSSTISKISSETTWPIKAKLHVEHPQERGMKVYLNGLGHVTKMAAMPIYGKNHKKIFSGTDGLNSTKLGM